MIDEGGMKMTEATERPWGYVHHKGLDQHLVGAVLENVAIVEDRHGNAKENADLIVKAVNAHDALVAALEDAVTWLHLASQNHGTSPLITKRHQVEAAKIEAALEAAK
jgi:hypothetical protein